jgi:hypothetical protein
VKAAVCRVVRASNKAMLVTVVLENCI